LIPQWQNLDNQLPKASHKEIVFGRKALF